MNKNIDKEFDEKFGARVGNPIDGYHFKETGAGSRPQGSVKDIKQFLHTKLAEQREKIIKDFKEGKLCGWCGAKKETNLTDWCNKCLEEN